MSEVFSLTCHEKNFNVVPQRNQVLHGSLIGNPVKIGDGPAAVTGDEIRMCHCSETGMGRREK